MAWQLTYYAARPDEPKVGDVWPEPDWARSSEISPEYLRDWAGKRPPLMVMLPSRFARGELFLLDRRFSSDPKLGWSVAIAGELVHGQMPDITLTPSINCVGRYHGYIKHGMITDDCEGRTFGKAG